MQMALEAQSCSILHFGVFEVDVRAGEVRKQGIRIKLQEQPFHVLSVLLRRPGEIVTREELRAQLWQSDTFVDFDNGLNTSINKLREALGDSADSPRFIETLPRRGYRFIAPVNGADGPARVATTGVSAAARTSSLKMAVAVLVLGAGIAGGLLWHSRKPLLTEKDTIVLGDFANSTGDPVFDDTLKQGLRVQLEQSPFLNILSDEKVGEELQLMGRAKDERLTKDLARDLCQRVGSKAFLAGSISSLGTHYVISLSALNCQNGDGLASEQVEAESREQVLKALDEPSTRMRKKLGESLPSIQKYDAPVEQATTPSLDALKAYTLGLKTWAASGAHKTIPLFQRAVELDPKFAMAYGRLAVAYSAAGDAHLSADNMRKAYELRGRLSERERLYLESHYYHVATGELEKAAQTYELWKQIYPRDRSPYDNLQNVYAYQGRQEEALAEGLEALRLQPNNVTSYEDVVVSYLCVNRPDKAQSALQQAEQRMLQSEALQFLRYQIAFLRNDVGEMEQLVAASASSQRAPFLEGEEGFREAQVGRLRRARPLWLRAVKSAQNHGPAEFATYYEVTAGLIEAYLGNSQQARADVAAGQKLTVNRLSEPLATLALAIANDASGAEKLSADLNKRWPLDSVVQRYWLPTIRAAVALDGQKAEEAIELLRTMGTYDMSVEATLAPVYLRGRAYLVEGNGNAAAAEFQKILDHPGLVGLGLKPVGALAHLGLARAYFLQGDKAKSRAAYKDFLELWKDADPDIPIFQQAKAEYAKLK